MSSANEENDVIAVRFDKQYLSMTRSQRNERKSQTSGKKYKSLEDNDCKLFFRKKSLPSSEEGMERERRKRCLYTSLFIDNVYLLME